MGKQTHRSATPRRRRAPAPDVTPTTPRPPGLQRIDLETWRRLQRAIRALQTRPAA